VSSDTGRENEGRLLGCILWSPGILTQVLRRVTADYFQYQPYRFIYQIIATLVDEDQAVDDLAIVQRAAATGKIDAIGGAAVVADLSGMVSGSSSWEMYADRMVDADRRRKMMAVAREIGADIAEGKDVGTVALRASARMQEIAASGGSIARNMADVAAQVFRDIQAVSLDPNARRAIPTKIASIDIVAGEMLPGELIIFAGRPSMGKTSVLMSILRSAGEPCLVASAEMTTEQLIIREMSAASGSSFHQVVNAKFPVDKWVAVAGTAGNPALKAIDVIDRGRLAVERISEEAYRAKQRSDITFLAVDYLQMITSNRRFERRDLEVNEITLALKGLAKELNLVVLCAAQINREAEKGERLDKRPQLHHLRESGAIEQHADRVYGIYRHGKYFDKMPEHLMGITELGIVKNRNGPIGKALLEFQAPTMSFASADIQLASEYRSYIEAGGR